MIDTYQISHTWLKIDSTPNGLFIEDNGIRIPSGYYHKGYVFLDKGDNESYFEPYMETEDYVEVDTRDRLIKDVKTLKLYNEDHYPDGRTLAEKGKEKKRLIVALESFIRNYLHGGFTFLYKRMFDEIYKSNGDRSKISERITNEYIIIELEEAEWEEIYEACKIGYEGYLYLQEAFEETRKKIARAKEIIGKDEYWE